MLKTIRDALAQFIARHQESDPRHSEKQIAEWLLQLGRDRLEGEKKGLSSFCTMQSFTYNCPEADISRMINDTYYQLRWLNCTRAVLEVLAEPKSLTKVLNGLREPSLEDREPESREQVLKAIESLKEPRLPESCKLPKFTELLDRLLPEIIMETGCKGLKNRGKVLAALEIIKRAEVLTQKKHDAAWEAYRALEKFYTHEEEEKEVEYALTQSIMEEQFPLPVLIATGHMVATDFVERDKSRAYRNESRSHQAVRSLIERLYVQSLEEYVHGMR